LKTPSFDSTATHSDLDTPFALAKGVFLFQNYADKIETNHLPRSTRKRVKPLGMVFVSLQGGKSAVLISLEDFKAYEETAYLMASPNNASRLNEAIAEIEAGNAIKKNLIEE